jgi:hypothetical protein
VYVRQPPVILPTYLGAKDIHGKGTSRLQSYLPTCLSTLTSAATTYYLGTMMYTTIHKHKSILLALQLSQPDQKDECEGRGGRCEVIAETETHTAT